MQKITENNADAAQTAGHMLLSVEKSATGKRWLYRGNSETEQEGRRIAQCCGLSDIVGSILASRGIPLPDVPEYINPRIKNALPDPSVFLDMEVAIERLCRAVLAKERIAIFSDYDVDGSVSAALMVRWLRGVGCQPTVYIPHRIREGYGPSVAAMEMLAQSHDVILTLDCGTLAFDPIKAVQKSQNVQGAEQRADVIIFDHHLGGETLPECVAVVNPNRQDESGEFSYLCAAGVIFVALVAANRYMRNQGFFADGRAEPNLIAMLDMVALATVADVVQLKGLNRAFVRQGLRVLAQRGNAGLRALSDKAGIDSCPTTYHIGFILAPRLNSAGRMGLDPSDIPVKLLTTEDEYEAVEIAERLEACNKERRAIEKEVFESAVAQMENENTTDSDAVICVVGEGWHEGVLGIVASRLKEKYGRPTLVFSSCDGVGKGSGRSVEGFNFGYVLSLCLREKLLIRGGGHYMAVGLTVDMTLLDALVARLNAHFAMQKKNFSESLVLMLDAVLDPRGVTLDLVEHLNCLAPYGMGASQPRLAILDCKIARVIHIGEDHLKISIASGSCVRSKILFDAMLFRAFESDLGAFFLSKKNKSVYLVGSISVNIWKGRKSVQFLVEDAA